MASSSIALAAAAAKIQTVAQVRAAMGAVTVTLAKGYALLPQVTTVSGLQDEARSLLDKVNQTATKLYNVYTDDPELQDEEISTVHAHAAGAILADANSALKLIEEATTITFDVASIVSDALAVVGRAAGTTLQTATNALAAGATAFVWASWPTLLIVAVVAYFFRRPLLGALRRAMPV